MLTTPKTPLTAGEFVRIWQGSKTLAEVCERTGYSASYASQRASRIRRSHPGLKKFARGPAATLEIPDPEIARAELALADADAASPDAVAVRDDDGEEGWDQ